MAELDPRILWYYSSKNFSVDENATYKILKAKKSEVEEHWFLRSGNFKSELIYNGLARYYYSLDDRSHALYGKSALYFKIQKNDEEPVPVFLGFDTDNDYKGVGIFLGGDYPSEDMGKQFDYGLFAQKFYEQINNIRRKIPDYAKFAPWAMKHMESILLNAISGQEIDYDKTMLDPQDFVHIRGIDSLEFLVGLYDNKNGKQYIDNNVYLELVGYRLYAARENLLKFAFDNSFIIKAYEKALSYIEQGQFGSIDELPHEGVNREGITVYNPDIDETTELSSGVQAVVRLRLDGLSGAWNDSIIGGNLNEKF